MLYKLKEDDSLLVNIKETREILGLGKSSTKVYSIIHDNNIEYVKFGRRMEISRESLYNYINSQLKKST